MPNFLSYQQQINRLDQAYKRGKIAFNDYFKRRNKLLSAILKQLLFQWYGREKEFNLVLELFGMLEALVNQTGIRPELPSFVNANKQKLQDDFESMQNFYDDLAFQTPIDASLTKAIINEPSILIDLLNKEIS